MSRHSLHNRGIKLAYADEFEAAAKLGSADEARRVAAASSFEPVLAPLSSSPFWVHELAHELLHRSSDRKMLSKTVRETEAEAVAFVVSQAIGLDTNTAGSDYIQIYAGDKNTFAHSLVRVQKTATAIISAVVSDDAGKEAADSAIAHAA